MTLHPLKPKRSAGGGFFTVFRGASAYWISEDYHLYYSQTDTERDRYFLERERNSFIKDVDTRLYKIDGRTYVVKFMCDIGDSEAEKIVQAYAKKNWQKVVIDE